jgi:beta-glucanase (GH16 family)
MGAWVAGGSPMPHLPSSLVPSVSLSPSPAASASRCPGAAAAGQGRCPSPGSTRSGTSPAGPTPVGASPPFAPAAGKRWSLNFSEEFNGSDYNHSRLTPCFDWNTGSCTASFNDGRERYLPSQVTVSNGTAKLTATPAATPYPSSACQNDSCTYNSGLLSTARPSADNGSDYLYKFTYGYVESRFKFPATQGFFTAFWMLPADTSYQYRSEIDILELLGDDPTTMFMTYSYDNRSQSFAVNKSKFNNGACPVRDYSKEFVSMGVDWEPNRIAWYIDGIKCAEYTDSSQIENGPMQLILNMMVDNNWQRRWGVGLTDDTLTRQLEVDYIRVYQQVPA